MASRYRAKHKKWATMTSDVALRAKLSASSIRAAIEKRLPLSLYSVLFRRRFLADTVVDIRTLDTFEMEAFPDSGPRPWLDRSNALSEINKRAAEPGLADQFRQWDSDGYLVLEKCIAESALDSIWSAYESAIEQGRVIPEDGAGDNDPYPGRFLSPHKAVPEINELLHNPTICDWVQKLCNRTPIPYQTIASFAGSEQAVHSDSVHMTTYPLGYMVAAWIAFEDIHEDSGPVVYYPGSHRLPYLSSRSVGIQQKSTDYDEYQKKYEPAIQRLLDQQGLAPRYLTAKKGDVLLWHANLLHGGSPRKNSQLSRKAVVCHYFLDGAVSYHDLTGRQTYLESNRVI